MKLYHGTYLENLIKIIKDGKLDNTKTDESTSEFDDLFVKYLGENMTANAIYFADDIIYTKSGYDYEFEVDTNSELIDKNKLFVADFDARVDMSCAETDEEALIFAKKYKESFIPFNEYEKKLAEYDCNHTCREFLYFDTIDVSSQIHNNKDEILDEFRRNWMYKEDYKEQLGSFYDR
ncbi:MAG: hypothetical protein IJ086_15305 [Clostridium sp.]|nr:hypothetical protein [Clostridium sp.]MBQ9000043.1 hypothetical protein [Clostridium sp.]